MGVAVDNLKLAGHDAWRDNLDWLLPEGHKHLAFIGQWVRARNVDAATIERHYLLAVHRLTPQFIWLTRQAAYLTQDHGDFEYLTLPTPATLEALQGGMTEALAYLAKHKYRRLY